MKYSVIKSCEGFFKIVSKTEFENKCKQFEECLEKVLPFGLNLTKFLAPNCEVKFDKEKTIDKRHETSICYYAVYLRLICKGDLNEISRKQIYHLWSNDLICVDVQKTFKQYDNKKAKYDFGQVYSMVTDSKTESLNETDEYCLDVEIRCDFKD